MEVFKDDYLLLADCLLQTILSDSLLKAVALGLSSGMAEFGIFWLNREITGFSNIDVEKIVSLDAGQLLKARVVNVNYESTTNLAVQCKSDRAILFLLGVSELEQVFRDLIDIEDITPESIQSIKYCRDLADSLITLTDLEQKRYSVTLKALIDVYLNITESLSDFLNICGGREIGLHSLS